MAMNNNGGKGSAVRPLGVTREQFGNNFDAIFAKKKPHDSVVVVLPHSGVEVTLKAPVMTEQGLVPASQ
jgi:hypothetical protein